MWGGERKTHPNNVRQILTKRSAPQPAIMKTPMGGTVVTVSLFSLPYMEIVSESPPSLSLWRKRRKGARSLGRDRIYLQKMVMITIRSAEMGFVPAIFPWSSFKR